MYPRINELVRILHGHDISSFLVTNAQFPDAIRLVQNDFYPPPRATWFLHVDEWVSSFSLRINYPAYSKDFQPMHKHLDWIRNSWFFCKLSPDLWFRAVLSFTEGVPPREKLSGSAFWVIVCRWFIIRNCLFTFQQESKKGWAFHFQYCYNLQINHLSLTKVEHFTVIIRNSAQTRLSTHLIGWKSWWASNLNSAPTALKVSA